MEIKIDCDCGQRYGFEVEPENGRMPVEINCPSCSSTGTEKANAMIASQLKSASIVVTIPSFKPHPQRTPAPARPNAPVAPPPVPTVEPSPAALTAGASKLRLRGSSETHGSPPPVPAAGPAEDIAALMAPPPPATATAAKPRKVEKVFGEPHMGKAMAGAVLGASIMTAIWFGLWKGTHGTWGIMALGVGWMAGFFARLIGRSEGQKMGLATMAVALAFTFGFQFYRASTEVSEASHEIRIDMTDLDKEFDKELADAKALVKAVPTGTDGEIRAYLVGKDGNPDTPEAISAEAVKEFRDEDLKDAREMVSGKVTKESRRAEVKKFEDAVADSGPMRIYFWVRALGIFSIFSIIGGAGIAFRFGNGEG